MNTFSRKDTKFIKGIAIILMFYHHLFTSYGEYLEGVTYHYTLGIAGVPMAYFLGTFGKICVALFVFLSGYGTYISLKNSENMSKTLGQKILRLYKVHWRVLIVFIPICLICGTNNVENWDIPKTVKNFLALDISVCSSVTFLTPFLILMVITPMILFFSDKIHNVFTSCVVVVISQIVGLFVLPHLSDTILGSTINDSVLYRLLSTPLFLLLPQYLSGLVCAKYNLISKVKTKFQNNPIAAIGAAVVVFYIATFRQYYNIEYDFIYAPLFTMAMVVLFENKVGRVIRKPFEKIGEHSTIMWMCHTYYWRTLIQRIVFAPYYSLLICLLLIAITYTTSIVITFVFDKFVSEI